MQSGDQLVQPIPVDDGGVSDGHVTEARSATAEPPGAEPWRSGPPLSLAQEPFELLLHEGVDVPHVPEPGVRLIAGGGKPTVDDLSQAHQGAQASLEDAVPGARR